MEAIGRVFQQQHELAHAVQSGSFRFFGAQNDSESKHNPNALRGRRLEAIQRRGMFPFVSRDCQALRSDAENGRGLQQVIER